MSEVLSVVPPVKVESPDLWLEINTFRCPYGRITPEECEKLRSRPSAKEYFRNRKSVLKVQKGKVLLKPLVCEECMEWQKLAIEVYEKRKLFLEEQKQKKCELKNKVKGGSVMKKTGQEQKQGQERKDELKVLLDFSVAPELLEIVRKKAKEELRPLGLQILWELKMSLRVKEMLIREELLEKTEGKPGE